MISYTLLKYLKIFLISTALCLCSQKLLAIVIDDAKPSLIPPHKNYYPTMCLSWKSVAPFLETFDVTSVSANIFNIKIKGTFGTSYFWYFSVENITASSKEEALEKVKNILNVAPASSIQYSSIHTSDGGFTTSTCSLSSDGYTLVLKNYAQFY